MIKTALKLTLEQQCTDELDSYHKTVIESNSIELDNVLADIKSLLLAAGYAIDGELTITEED